MSLLKEVDCKLIIKSKNTFPVVEDLKDSPPTTGRLGFPKAVGVGWGRSMSEWRLLGERVEERVNPGGSRGAGSVRAGAPCASGLSFVGDEFRQEASCRELARGLSVYSPFRSFIGGKREKK